MNNEPNEPGIWQFRGVRRTASGRNLVETNDLIDVQPLANGELAAYFFGRSAPYRIDMFTGEWRPLTIDFDGERSC